MLLLGKDEPVGEVATVRLLRGLGALAGDKMKSIEAVGFVSMREGVQS